MRNPLTTKQYDIVVKKDSSEEVELNISTESNAIMNAEERKHKESNKAIEEDAVHTAQKNQKIYNQSIKG